MKVVNSLVSLSILFTAANTFAFRAVRVDEFPAQPVFDHVVFNDTLTDSPAAMGYGSLIFATHVMQEPTVQEAYANLENYGRVGKITVQKIQLPQYKSKTNRYILSAYKQTGFTTSTLSATLTIDETADFDHTPQDAPARHHYDIKLDLVR